MAMLESVLVANRGEIACRVIRSAERLGLRTIAVYSEADRGALHTRLADTAVCIGPAPARESYLNVEALLRAARETGAQSVHPGYGFLSENAGFAAACADHGLVFVGPPADAIRRMGSKSGARRLMAAAGVPVLPGYDAEDQSDATLTAQLAALGLPLLIKPTAGGGGKGMRVVRDAADFAEALSGARREAAKAFGDERVLLERFVERGRHVEIQVFADRHGQALHLFERDCSLQRRHQKVVEEAPAPGLTEAQREAMGAAAVAAASAVGYVGAGTVEFLFDGRDFYFLEMNTRLQVEHPVTEMITGLDLVEWQLRVAAGEPLPRRQHEIGRDGHAVEARLYAEDPDRGFLPSTGRLARLRWPARSASLRIDTGVEEGDSVSVHYDPMLAKIIAWGPDRAAALARLRAAIEDTEVTGVRTNARYLWEILGHERVRAGDVSTRLLEQELSPGGGVPEGELRQAWVLAGASAFLPADPVASAVQSPWCSNEGFRMGGPARRRIALELDGTRHWIDVEGDPGGVQRLQLGDRIHDVELRRSDEDRVVGRIDGAAVGARIGPARDGLRVRRNGLAYEFLVDEGEEHHASAEYEGHLKAPMPGHVLDVRTAPGARVQGGAVLVVLEAMKMEHSLAAPWNGTATDVLVKPGDRVEEGADLVLLEPDEPPHALRHSETESA